jgi:uncharacterized Zn finger protein
MSFYSEYTYRTVAEERRQNERKLALLRIKNADIEPIVITDRKIANNWWGISWNKNLESYADYSNRIGRGKRYIKNGAVVDLRISAGKVSAQVLGSKSKPYKVEVHIDPLSKEKWQSILDHYSHRIDSLENLTKGEFPKELIDTFTTKESGLFPSPAEIHFECNCPDWASMCKHVAAVLYGIGARFDKDPTLFFLLREIGFEDLIQKTVEQTMTDMLANAEKKSKRELADTDINDLFNLHE